MDWIALSKSVSIRPIWLPPGEKPLSHGRMTAMGHDLPPWAQRSESQPRRPVDRHRDRINDRDPGGGHHRRLAEMVSDKGEIGIAGSNERDRNEVDTKVRSEAGGVERRRRQFEIAWPRKG